MDGSLTQYIIIALGIYCIYRGISTLVTGNLSAREEASLSGFSETGVKKYKLLYSIANILCGLFFAAVAVIRVLGLVQSDTLRYVVIGAAVLLVTSFIVIRVICKKA